MDVQHAFVETVEGLRAEPPQVSGQNHQIGAHSLQRRAETLVRFGGRPCGGYDPRRQAMNLGEGQGWSVRLVADDQSGVRVEGTRLDSRDDRAHAAAAPGCQEPQLHQRSAR